MKITHPARNSDRDQASNGYPSDIEPDGARASFYIIVAGNDDVAVYRKLIGAIMEIELHEAREFLRVSPTYWAPFHPHRVDGMNRWGNPHEDLKFGLA